MSFSAVCICHHDLIGEGRFLLQILPEMFVLDFSIYVCFSDCKFWTSFSLSWILTSSLPPASVRSDDSSPLLLSLLFFLLFKIIVMQIVNLWF